MAIQNEQRFRLSIDVEPELGQRIKAAAYARNLSVRDYVVTIVQRALESDKGNGEHPVAFEKIRIPPLSEAEYAESLEAIADLKRFRAELFAKHGKLRPESWELLNESREERTRELIRAVEG